MLYMRDTSFLNLVSSFSLLEPGWQMQGSHRVIVALWSHGGPSLACYSASSLWKVTVLYSAKVCDALKEGVSSGSPLPPQTSGAESLEFPGWVSLEFLLGLLNHPPFQTAAPFYLGEAIHVSGIFQFSCFSCGKE